MITKTVEVPVDANGRKIKKLGTLYSSSKLGHNASKFSDLDSVVSGPSLAKSFKRKITRKKTLENQGSDQLNVTLRQSMTAKSQEEAGPVTEFASESANTGSKKLKKKKKKGLPQN